MFQSVAATPALITPPSRRLIRRPLGRRSSQVSSVHFQVSHPVYALALSLGGGATQLFRGSHTRAHDAPIATPQSFRPREADTRVTAGRGRPGNTIVPPATAHRKHHAEKSRDHRPSRTTHTKDGTTIGLQATGPCGAPAARAGLAGTRLVVIEIRVRTVGRRCGKCHFSTDMRAHMHLLSLLMCRSGLKLAACYLLGTAYLRSLSLLSLLSRALTLSRPRTQTGLSRWARTRHNEERCPIPLPAISVLTLRDPTLSPDRARSTQARSTLHWSYRDSES